MVVYLVRSTVALMGYCWAEMMVAYSVYSRAALTGYCWAEKTALPRVGPMAAPRVDSTVPNWAPPKAGSTVPPTRSANSTGQGWASPKWTVRRSG